MTNIIEFLKNHLRLLGYLGCILLVATAIWSLLIDTHHAHSWVEKHVPAFWSFFGFLGAAVIVLVARVFAKAGIQVDDDFYCKRDSIIENGEEK
jgi:hypothetical protein